MPFEINTPLLGGSLTGSINAYVTQPSSVNPITIIEADKDFEVHINWELSGTLTPFIAGNWRVHVFLESIGNAPELNLPVVPVIIPLKLISGPVSYSATVVVPANTVKPVDSVPYKLVATVTFHSVLDRPGPMAGFVEGPLLQFYVSDFS
jgi:hypothetical protein